MQITSNHNPLLKSVRRAIASGRPTDDGLIPAEGPHLLEEALCSEWQVEAVLVDASKPHSFPDAIEIEPRAFASLAATETSQGVLALVRPRRWNWAELRNGNALIVALDGVQDPGNAGAIVRSAEAFGATGVVFSRGSVHVANQKFLRASAGSIFRMPFLEGVAAEDLATQGLAVFALDARAEQSIDAADLTQPSILITGSEGAGVSPELLARATRLRIPSKTVESLNAAVACSIALFEVQRQRSL